MQGIIKVKTKNGLSVQYTDKSWKSKIMWFFKKILMAKKGMILPFHISVSSDNKPLKVSCNF